MKRKVLIKRHLEFRGFVSVVLSSLPNCVESIMIRALYSSYLSKP